VHKQEGERLDIMKNATVDDTHTIEMYGELLGSLGPGDAFGEMGLLENKKRLLLRIV
jgi:hypothetical protein